MICMGRKGQASALDPLGSSRGSVLRTTAPDPNFIVPRVTLASNLISGVWGLVPSLVQGQSPWPNLALAGEASGDVLGARLIAALRARRPDLQFCRHRRPPHARRRPPPPPCSPMADLAVMGLAEVLARLRTLRRRLDEAVADIEAQRPDLVVTIDSPGFSLRLLNRIAGLKLKRIQYVAPQVWGLARKPRARLSGPVGPPAMPAPVRGSLLARHGVPARFVGHPGAAIRRRRRRRRPLSRPATTSRRTHPSWC
ncbi:MAG: hypothetical protein WDN04_02455 [Rhodospirillales bacterium]